MLRLRNAIHILARVRLMQHRLLLYPLLRNSQSYVRKIRQYTKIAQDLYRHAQAYKDCKAIPIPPGPRGLSALLSTYGVGPALASKIGFNYEQLQTVATFFFGHDLITLPAKKGSIAPIDALSVALSRLRSTADLQDLKMLLRYHESMISTIFNFVCHHLAVHFFGYLVNARWVPGRRCLYAEAIKSVDKTPGNACGFIDGKRIRVCRPSIVQDFYYSGYTSNHNQLYIGISFPDGTFSMHGPVYGRHNDLGALKVLGLKDDQVCEKLTGEMFSLGADGIFQNQGIHFLTADPNRMSVADCHRFSSARTSVEWMFGTIEQLFPFLSQWKRMRVFGTSPEEKFQAACVLTQVHNSFYPNQVSQHFGIKPPTLEELFQG